MVSNNVGLSDAVSINDVVEGSAYGKRVILPSSFTGSPRDMHQRYQDSMARVRHFHKPDLFITMTCNPKWQEILDALPPGQTAADRPDIVARVFHMKLEALLVDLGIKGARRVGVFGRVVSFAWVVEFQKRGLPHAHILLILHPGDKPMPDDYDQYCCAEIPDPVTQPLLYATVSSCMMHGPCGPSNPSSPCMQDDRCPGVCCKKFPRVFCEQTHSSAEGFPEYRRRDDGRRVPPRSEGQREFDNRDVVPYNPFLSEKYNCHINVEICTTIKSVKYLYKYVYKGHDKIIVEIRRAACPDGAGPHGGAEEVNQNEVAQYQEARYIGPVEACWRIFSLAMHGGGPAVERLPVHLDGQHMVTWLPEADNDLRQIVARELDRITKLSSFFQVNASGCPVAAALLYHEMPSKFTWHPGNLKKGELSRWLPRLRGRATEDFAGSTIGRMYAVSPKEGERYYLRTLLAHVRGPRSYEHLRTVNGEVCDTFKEAAVRLGLVQDDRDVYDTLREAVTHCMPVQLRRLLAIMLLHSEVTEPVKVWEEFKENMSEDFLHTARTTSGNPQLGFSDFIFAQALDGIDTMLKAGGRDLKSLGMPTVDIQVSLTCCYCLPHFRYLFDTTFVALPPYAPMLPH